MSGTLEANGGLTVSAGTNILVVNPLNTKITGAATITGSLYCGGLLTGASGQAITSGGS